MALPLIMAAGAAMLGGGRYLMGKESQRQSKSMLDDLQSQVASSQNPQMAQYYAQQANAAQNQIANQGVMGTIMNPFGGQSMIGDLQQQFAQNEYETNQARALQQQQMGDMYSETNLGIYNKLADEWQQNQGQFAEMQSQYQRAMLALDNPSNLNTSTALYNLMAIIEPGGRVTQNEDGMFDSSGGFSARAVNWLNEWQGKGLSDKSINEIRDSINRQYLPAKEAANRGRVNLESQLDRMRQSGRNVQSPIGTLGIEWGANTPDRNTLEQQQAARNVDVNQLPLPPGFTTEPPKTRARTRRDQRGGR